MIEIRIHGRGGQGGVTLAKILATAQHLEGRSAQAFGIYAAERSGAPLQAFLRYDDQPIHNPNQIYQPDHLVVLDPTLVSASIVAGLKPGGFILLNSDQAPEEFAGQDVFRAYRIATVGATAIARQNQLGTRAVPIVNTALAGAAARLLDLDLEVLERTFEEMHFHARNFDAARLAYADVCYTSQPLEQREAGSIQKSRERHSGLLDGNSGAPPAIHTGEWAHQQPVWRNATPPCNFICPAGNDVQGFLAELAADRVDRALEILLRTTPLPSVCGRVCPGFCMNECNRIQLDGAVNVRALERYAGDHGQARIRPDKLRAGNVAVIGSGPAGLSAAWQLALLGYRVTIFEADAEPGGLLRTGIPSYRLPRDVLDREIQRILDAGVRLNLDSPVDHERLQQITQMHDAVIAATGLQRLATLDLGPDLRCVMQGIEFLDRCREDDIEVLDEQVVVIGGGNTAVDAARSALRKGAERVRILYRRSREEMPAIAAEVDAAIDEGVEIEFLSSPLRIMRPNGRLHLVCQKMTMGDADESGRRRPQPLDGSTYGVICDRVILAIGQSADMSLFPPDTGLQRDGPLKMNRGHHDRNGGTVFAAGDLLTNEGTVTAAIGCGRHMAALLHNQLTGAAHPNGEATTPVIRADQISMHHFELHQPESEKVLPMAQRKGSFAEVHQGLEDTKEARRCLSCGVCNACDRCVTWCPDGVLRREGGQIIFDYEYCKGCGICVTECSRAVISMPADPARAQA